jgi:ubiquitin-conjugating enzyme E2 C
MLPTPGALGTSSPSTKHQRSSSANPVAGKPTKAAGDGVTKRLQTELMSLMMSSDKHATAFPLNGDNLFHWVGTLRGGDDTPYEGLTYKLDIRFPADYPISAPAITFTTPCYHPNIDTAGNICLDILKDKWSASLSVSAVLQSLRSLLGDPNTESPLNGQAASLWSDKTAFRGEVLRLYSRGGGA